MVTEKKYTIAGIIFNGHSAIGDVETCQDFLGLHWSRSELYSDVRDGILPPGTVINTPGDKHLIVMLKGCEYYLSTIEIIRRNNERITD